MSRRTQKQILKSRFQGSRTVLDLRSAQKKDLKSLGELIKKSRSGLGLSQKDYAEFVDLPIHVLRRLEKGVYLGKHLPTMIKCQPYAVPIWMSTLFIRKGWCESITDIL